MTTLPAANRLAPLPRRWARAWANWVLLVLYVALSAVLFTHHEPWRDETRAWLMARDVPDVGTLFKLMGYEGSPALWFLVLRPFARAGCPYVVMPLLHHLLALGAVTLLLFRSPFSILEKALFVFGYFGLYEYNAIARSYVLSMGLLFALAATYTRRDAHPWPHGLLLALLAQTNTHSLLISLVWAAAWAGSRWRRQGRAGLTTLAGPLGLWGASVACAVWQMLPPADLDTRLTGLAPLPPGRALTTAGEVLRNVFWPSAYPPAVVRHRLELVLAPGMLAATALLWRGRRQAAVLFYASLGLLMALFLFKYVGSIRHHGLLLLLLLAAQWVARSGMAREASRPAAVWPPRPALLLALLLLPQLYGGYKAFGREVAEVFSGELAAARFLQSQELLGPSVLLATYPSAMSSGVLAWLPRPERVFFVELQRFGTFVTWTRELQDNGELSVAEVLRRVDAQARRGRYRQVVILLAGETELPPEGGRNRLAFQQEGQWRADETIRVYCRQSTPWRPPHD